MPRRDGYERMAALRARGIRTPAIALTAFAHVAKPIDTAALVATVAGVADGAASTGVVG
jgi:CheY-like chemotaxis protein